MKRLVSLILVVISIFALTVPVSAKSNVKSRAEKKYKSYLSSKKGTYEIIDIDKNGIPELIFNDNIKRLCLVYTYNSKKNKMVRILKKSTARSLNPIKYNLQKHQILYILGQYGGKEEHIYKILGKKAKKVVSFSYSYNKNGKNCTTLYAVNNKKVSEKKYTKKYKSYTKGFVSCKKNAYDTVINNYNKVYYNYLKKKLEKNKSVFFDDTAAVLTQYNTGTFYSLTYNAGCDYNWDYGLTSAYVVDIDKDGKKEMITIYCGQVYSKQKQRHEVKIKLGILYYKNKKYKENIITVDNDFLNSNAARSVNFYVSKNKIVLFEELYTNAGAGSTRYQKVKIIDVKNKKPKISKEYCYSYHPGSVTVSEQISKKEYYNGRGDSAKERKAVAQMKKDARICPELFNYTDEFCRMYAKNPVKNAKLICRISTDFTYYSSSNGYMIVLKSEDKTNFQKWIKKYADDWKWFGCYD